MYGTLPDRCFEVLDELCACCVLVCVFTKGVTSYAYIPLFSCAHADFHVHCWN